MTLEPSFTVSDLKARAESVINEMCGHLETARNTAINYDINWSDPQQVFDFRSRVTDLTRITGVLDDLVALRQNIDWWPRNATVDILIEQLSDLVDQPETNELPIYFDFDGSSINDYIISYRGIYTHIALQSTTRAATMDVTAMYKRMLQMRSNVMFGYKGGEFNTYGITPVWAAEYGKSDGRPVIGFRLDQNNNCIILMTGDPYDD